MSYYRDWAPYVPVAQRKRNGLRRAQKRMKKGESLQPVSIAGNKIAKTFWGQAWCDHFEQYRDFANRLPRGKTYARNGSVCDLRITKGKITGMVSGSALYDVVIKIKPLDSKKWKTIRKNCGSSVHSLIDLMRGQLSDEVIARLTDAKAGMFPIGNEMSMSCDCPDYSSLCKHLAAVMYGVGNRLDSSPELLFLLRGVDQSELIAEAIASGNAQSDVGLDTESDLQGDDLGAIFGIEMAETPTVKKKASRKKAVKKKASPKKKKATQKKRAAKKRTGQTKPAKQKVAKKTIKKPAVKRKATKKATQKKKVAKKKAIKKKAVKKVAGKKGR